MFHNEADVRKTDMWMDTYPNPHFHLGLNRQIDYYILDTTACISGFIAPKNTAPVDDATSTHLLRHCKNVVCS